MKSKFVSLHPYFKIHPGKLDVVKAGFPRFVEKTATEKATLFYEFSVSGNEVFCRKAYEDAEGLLAHLDNIGTLLSEMLTMADLLRLEVHGPAEELAKLKVPLVHLSLVHARELEQFVGQALPPAAEVAGNQRGCPTMAPITCPMFARSVRFIRSSD